MDLSCHEAERERMVDSTAKELYIEYLNDGGKFDKLDNGYEFLSQNSSHIQRALRNLDAAIKGEEVARDAVFTALHYIQRNLKLHCIDEAEVEVVSAYELYQDAFCDAADARRDAGG